MTVSDFSKLPDEAHQSSHDVSGHGKASLAEHLRGCRLKRGLSLGQLSNLSGISKGHLGNIEKGRVLATVRVLEKVAPHIGAQVVPLVEMAVGERKTLVERRFSTPRTPAARYAAATGPQSIGDLSEEERIILAWLRSLSPGQRKALADLAGFQAPLPAATRKKAR